MKITAFNWLGALGLVIIAGCAAQTSSAPQSTAVLTLGIAEGADAPAGAGTYTGDYTTTFGGTAEEVASRVQETANALREISSPAGLVHVVLTSSDGEKEFFVEQQAAAQVQSIAEEFTRPAATAVAPGAEHVGTTSSAITRNECTSDTCGGTWTSYCDFGFTGSCGSSWCFFCGHSCELPSGSECGAVY